MNFLYIKEQNSEDYCVSKETGIRYGFENPSNRLGLASTVPVPLLSGISPFWSTGIKNASDHLNSTEAITDSRKCVTPNYHYHPYQCIKPSAEPVEIDPVNPYYYQSITDHQNLYTDSQAQNLSSTADTANVPETDITLELEDSYYSGYAKYEPIYVLNAARDLFMFLNVRFLKASNILFCLHPRCAHSEKMRTLCSQQLSFANFRYHVRRQHNLRKGNDKSMNFQNQIFYSCHFCEAQLDNRDKLREHQNIHHPTLEMPPALCEVCGVVKQRIHMVKHIMSHKSNDEKRFAIGQIELAHRSRVDITRPSTYPCTECSKSYIKHTAFRSHMAWHSHEESMKIFVCKLCNKRCNVWAIMEYHIRVEHYRSEYSLQNLSLDKVAEHVQTLFKCEYCPTTGITSEFIQSHYTCSHNAEFLKITSSNYPFSSYQDHESSRESDDEVDLGEHDQYQVDISQQNVVTDQADSAPPLTNITSEPETDLLTAVEDRCYSEYSNYEPIYVVNFLQSIFMYFNIKFQKSSNTLLCLHPSCLYSENILYSCSPQLAFENVRSHVTRKHYPSILALESQNSRADQFLSVQLDWEESRKMLQNTHHTKWDSLLVLCEVCGVSMHRTRIVKHIMSHKSKQEKVSAIEEIRKGFRSKIDITKPSSFPCTECPQVFEQHVQFRMHIVSHIYVKSMKLLNCKLCAKIFTVWGDLKYHVFREHLSKNEFRNFSSDEVAVYIDSSFKCDHCPRIASTCKSLKWHYAICHDLELF